MESEGSLLDEADLRVDALHPAVAEAVLEGGVDEGAHPPPYVPGWLLPVFVPSFVCRAGWVRFHVGCF